MKKKKFMLWREQRVTYVVGYPSEMFMFGTRLKIVFFNQIEAGAFC
jgi:hypothetical protein